MDSASSFGTQETRHSTISETRNIYPHHPFFYNDQAENTKIGIRRSTLHRFAPSLSSPPWWVTGMPLAQQQADMAMGQDTLFHGETLFVSTTSSNHITLPFFSQNVWGNCGHTRLRKSTKFAFIIYFNEFLAASGWERDVQLHPEAADRLWATTHKKEREQFGIFLWT